MRVSSEPEKPAPFLAGMDIKIQKKWVWAGMVKMGVGMGTGRVQSYPYPTRPIPVPDLF